MPRIRCHYTDCAFIQNGYCNATSVELDPDEGCMTYVMDIEEEADVTTETESDFIEEEDDDDFNLYEDEDDSDFEWDDEDDDDDF
jgi:hypothetical protein